MFKKKILSLALATSMSFGMISMVSMDHVEASKVVSQQDLTAQLQGLRNEIKVLKSQNSKQEVKKRQEQIKALKEELKNLKENSVEKPSVEKPAVPVAPQEKPVTPQQPTEDVVDSEGGVKVSDFGVVANANFYNPANGSYYADKAFKTPATDDTVAINEAVQYASKNGIKDVFIPSGNYLIDPEGKSESMWEKGFNSGIQLESNMTLRMSKDTKIVTNTVNAPGYGLISLNQKENVQIIGGNLVGDMKTHPSGKHNYCYGITIANASKNVVVKDTNITEMEDDGIMIVDYTESLSGGERTENVEISNVKSHNNGRQGLTISTGSNIKVLDSEFSNQTKHAPMSGIDIELESYGHVGVENIEISGNTFKDNSYSGVVFSNMFNDKPGTMSKNLKLTKNNVSNSRFGIIASGKADGLEISNNKIDIDHLTNEYSVGVGSTSEQSNDVSIKSNTVVSKNKKNYSLGAISISPGTSISNNSLTGQRIGMAIYGGNPTLSENTIANYIELAIQRS